MEEVLNMHLLISIEKLLIMDHLVLVTRGRRKDTALNLDEEVNLKWQRKFMQVACFTAGLESKEIQCW
jgi:hypothetical protein